MHLACILRIKVYLNLTCLPSWTHLILTGLCYALGLRHSAKSHALSPLLLFHALFLSPHLCLQCCLYNLMGGQPENSWPLGGKYCVISNPSGHSGLHLPCFLQHLQHQHLSVKRLGWVTGTPTCSSVGGILSRETGLPGIMLATLGVSPAGCLGPNPYHPSPKVTNITPDQISIPFL